MQVQSSKYLSLFRLLQYVAQPLAAVARDTKIDDCFWAFKNFSPHKQVTNHDLIDTTKSAESEMFLRTTYKFAYENDQNAQEQI